MTIEFSHDSVFLHEAVDALIHDPNGFYIDGTFGMGGHSTEILKKLTDKGRLLAIDKDPSAVAIGKKLVVADNRFSIENGKFSDLTQWTNQHKIDGLLLDLGVSSPQLDNAERGFSFMRDGPLDMRMDTKQEETASSWLAVASAEEISAVLWKYGEERHARRIANTIVAERSKYDITTTFQLVKIIKLACPKYQPHKHPATRTFQAIRIHINKELEQLQQMLEIAVENMQQGARLVIISFHSLEDRIVKRFIRQQSQGKPMPKWLPITDISADSKLKIITNAHKPSASDIKQNVRARSAILRVAEKL